MPSARPARQSRLSQASAPNKEERGDAEQEKDHRSNDDASAVASSSRIESAVAPVAIDLGAFTVRISVGSSPASCVTMRCPNAIVRQAQQRRSTTNDNSSKWIIGPEIDSKCVNLGSLTVRQPMDRGVIVDWAAQKAILDSALTAALSQHGQTSAQGAGKQRLLEGRRVIITEAHLNLPDLQSALDLLLIEEYGAASIWRCSPAYLIPHSPNLFEPAPVRPGRRRSRPECMVIVDLGHGATHVIPVVGDDVQWKSVRRHAVSQRLLTNVLKEMLSLRQWDMMDEGWLVGHIKEQSCFVAARSGSRGERIRTSKEKPSQWSFAALVEMCQGTATAKNPIVQEYVLPNHSGTSKKAKYGFIKRGPGSEGEVQLDDDDFIANLSILKSSSGVSSHKSNAQEDDSEEQDDSSDDDFNGDSGAESASDSDRENDNPSARPKKKAKTAKTLAAKPGASHQPRPGGGANDDDESEQILVLERERFQVPEVMFNPSIVGLDGPPLHQVIRAAIESCDESVRDLMWSNVVLVGGGARMRGLRQRLHEELRSLAPTDVPLTIWTTDRADEAAIAGAKAIQTALPGSALSRLLDSRCLSADDYSLSAAREKFGSWSSV